VVFTAAFFLVRGAMKKYGLIKSQRSFGVALRGEID
jgi:hypothetical protein